MRYSTGFFGLLAGILVVSFSRIELVAASKFTPTSAYTKETIEGFTILVHGQVLEHAEVITEVRKELSRQLREIKREVPTNAVQSLKEVKIWVEWESKRNGGAEFHPSAEWLRAHHYNPEKAGGVEISNARNFVNWSRQQQPCIVLHELAHAYHFLVLGGEHAEILTTYRQARDRQIYNLVAYISGGKKKAYAMTNDKEYFAELTEAFFGKNDFYPFTRDELRKHDPAGYTLLARLWGVDD